MPEDQKPNPLMEKIVALAKRRGLIYPSSEIYGGLNGFWDYGPLGAELKRNIRDDWWKCMTHLRDDIVGLDAAIIMHPRVWEASGHATGFADPMCDCTGCKKRFRADQIEPQSGLVYEYTGAAEQKNPAKGCHEKFWVLIPQRSHREKALQAAIRYYQSRGLESPNVWNRDAEGTPIQDTTCFCPECGAKLTEPRSFNLMFKTHVGASEDASALTWLRPETAQAIFVQFKNVIDTSRMKVPFGIAQIGKAFRNEINPRNYTFRSREFEQMELEFFIKPDPHKGNGWGWQEWHKHWVEERLKWYERIGLPRNKLRVRDQDRKELAHYALACTDIEFEFPFGVQELEGIAARGDFDLAQHQKFSGKPLDYFDEETKTRYVPHVIEPSAGVDRIALALITSAYAEEEVEGDKGQEIRVVLRFHPRMAPVKAGVFPLLKNKPELVAKARKIADMLRPHMKIFYDESGAIGRRYRRQDEIGTPFGITVDFETLEGVRTGPDAGCKDTVTLRERDSMKQVRLPIGDLLPHLLDKIR